MFTLKTVIIEEVTHVTVLTFVGSTNAKKSKTRTEKYFFNQP